MKVIHGIQELPKFKRPVLTTGTFDGIHIGHRKILSRVIERAAAIQGESVLVTFHPHPRLVLFPDDNDLKLLNTLEEKQQLLSEMGLDYMLIIPFDGAFSRMKAEEYVTEFLKGSLNVHTLVVGYDHHFGRNRSGNYSLLLPLSEQLSFELEEIPAQDIGQVKVSSTKIRQALEAGDVKTAAEFLTYPYAIQGTVEHGQRLGKKLGFPTANLAAIDTNKLIPANGVYAAYAQTQFGRFNAMVNIGVRPTVSQNGTQHIEAHLFNFNQDLYGQKINLIFLDRMREEKLFSNQSELIRQLQLDAKQANEIHERLH